MTLAGKYYLSIHFKKERNGKVKKNKGLHD